MYLVRVQDEGLPAQTEIRTIVDNQGGPTSPSMVWTGQRYGVAWNDARDDPVANQDPDLPDDIYFNLLEPDDGARVLDEDLLLTEASTDRAHPSLVWTGSFFGLVWADTRHGDTEIYFRKITVNGDEVHAEAPLRITRAPGPSVQPSLVWTGEEFGLIWADGRSGDVGVYFTHGRFDCP